MLGQPVVRQLVRSGFNLRLLVRNQQKAELMFGNDVNYVEGDLSNGESLRNLLQDQDALYINLSVKPESGKNDFQPERDGLPLLLKHARQASIRRIGYLSSLAQLYQGTGGFRWWVFDIKHRAVENIKSSGIPYTIFYASTFMENFDKGAYRQGKIIALAGHSKYKMHLIAGSDYALQVAQAFRRNDANREYIIQGPEGFTADEAAKVFVTNYKPARLRVMKAPLALLRIMGCMINKYNYGAHIIEALNNYPEAFAASDTWQELGRPEVTFTQYIDRAD